MARRYLCLLASALLAGCSLTVNPDEGALCDGSDQCPSGYRCIKGHCTESGAACGDYVVDAGEACDDGNTDDGDGCSADCSSDETCGNGIVDQTTGEICDEGATNGTYEHCTTACDRVATCGDGVADDPNEQCDDGSDNGLYGSCRADCQGMGPFCGDGNVDEPYESCELGQGDSCQPCKLDCSGFADGAVCGDGQLCVGQETCDDGDEITETECDYGTTTCTLCNADCTAELFLTGNVCGDSDPDPVHEDCDDGAGEGEGMCLDNCSGFQACGDGDQEGTESCDDGFNDACGTCNVDCSAVGTGLGTCGDGSLCPENGEVCDDGYTDPCGSCNADCTGAGTGLGTCGDGTWCPENNESCDDGFQDACGTCNADCSGAGDGAGTCGDGERCPEFEFCDDGNDNGTISTTVAYCAPGCAGNQLCGNSVPEGTEICDDGPGEGDGKCLDDCSGTQLCGNSLQEDPEVCDDGPGEGEGLCTDDCTAWQTCGNGTQEGSEECDDGNDVDWDGCMACAVAEFRVNTETSSNQYGSSVAMAPDNSFVVVWTSDGGQDGDGKGVFGQRHGADGLPVGTEFQVNTETTSDQQEPSVATGADGRFVATWTGDGIRAQRYAAVGTPVGAEFTVNTQTGSAGGSKVGLAADGRFVIVWDIPGHDDADNSLGVYGQQYASDGAPVGSEFLVNTTTLGTQVGPDVAVGDDGRFVVAWTGEQPDSSNDDVYARRYGLDGTPAGDEFRVNTYLDLGQSSPTVSMAGDGRFVIVWSGRGPFDDASNVYGQLYGADGSAVGTEFEVNTSSVGDQLEGQVGMDANHGFVVGWKSDHLTPGVFGSHRFFGQRFDNSGQRIGPEFRMNDWSGNNISNDRLSLGMAPGGYFVAAWNTDAQDGDGMGVFGVRFDAEGIPLAPGQ